MRHPSLFPEMENDIRDRPVNVAKVPQRSPFRYPGGKTWLVPLFRRWMRSFRYPPEVLVEPFAGGGIIGLTAAFENLASRVVLVEMDDQVASVWETILGGEADWLVDRIVTFDLTLENIRREFSKKAASRKDLAFQTILKNRTAHGGILAEGAGVLKNGENGRGIHSRWYPQTLARRIRDIQRVADRIQFIHGDAFQVIAQYANIARSVFFLDPPYTAGGKRAGSRLYTHYQIDHDHLFSLCEIVEGEFLMTYDNTEEVKALAMRHGFETCLVAMKNTHHAEMRELLISKRMAWAEESDSVREIQTQYKARTSRKQNTRKS